MSKSLRTLIIFTFAMLQSIAPLVHAHIDGKQSGSSILAISPASTALVAGHIVDELSTQSSETQAICLPPEYQRNDALLVADASSGTPPVVAEKFYFLTTFQSVQHLPVRKFLYAPPAQAPPSV